MLTKKRVAAALEQLVADLRDLMFAKPPVNTVAETRKQVARAEALTASGLPPVEPERDAVLPLAIEAFVAANLDVSHLFVSSLSHSTSGVARCTPGVAAGFDPLHLHRVHMVTGSCGDALAAVEVAETASRAVTVVEGPTEKMTVTYQGAVFKDLLLGFGGWYYLTDEAAGVVKTWHSQLCASYGERKVCSKFGTVNEVISRLCTFEFESFPVEMDVPTFSAPVDPTIHRSYSAATPELVPAGSLAEIVIGANEAIAVRGDRNRIDLCVDPAAARAVVHAVPANTRS